MKLREGDLFVLVPPEKKIEDLISSAADTEEERLKLLIIELQILAWAKGKLPDEDGKVYLKMLYDELKKIREKNKKGSTS